jgi:hypothetical protein
VQTTELGQDSLDLGSVFFYDLILLDLNLPDMSGYDANRVFGPLRRIPRHPRDLATWLERSLVLLKFARPSSDQQNGCGAGRRSRRVGCTRSGTKFLLRAASNRGTAVSKSSVSPQQSASDCQEGEWRQEGHAYGAQ